MLAAVEIKPSENLCLSEHRLKTARESLVLCQTHNIITLQMHARDHKQLKK